MLTGPVENLWLYETAPAFNVMPAYGGVAYLTADQQRRVERLRQAQMLFRGFHKQFFLGEGRVDWEFPEVQAGNRRVQPFVPMNVLKLISKKTADLLFGEDPKLDCEDETQEGMLGDLVERTSLRELLKNSAVECSYGGEVFLEACIYRDGVYLERAPAREIFPEGRLMPDRQFASYCRYKRKNVGTEGAPLWLLLKTRYLEGRITRQLFQTDADGKIQNEAPLSAWDLVDPEPVPLSPLTITGIDRNTITWIPNELDEDQAVSDYDGLIELQALLDAKQTQMARVISQHADPAMAIPREMFDEQGDIRSAYKALPFDDAGKLPQYIVWNAQLDAAEKDRWFTLNSLLILAEMSPSLLGLKQGAAPDAYKKLRLEATNALAMATRKAATWSAGIKRMLAVAQDLEQTIPGTRYDRQPIGVQLRDGIPVDELEQAETISTLRAAKVMSVERAIELQIPDPAAQEVELRLLKEEEQQAAAMASLMAAPTSGGQEATTEPASAAGQGGGGGSGGEAEMEGAGEMGVAA